MSIFSDNHFNSLIYTRIHTYTRTYTYKLFFNWDFTTIYANAASYLEVFT